MSRRLLRSIPRSPFSTPLSGSAREAEDHIRNIFQYQKKRPPILLLALACALALLCGGLVSCQPVQGPSGGSTSLTAGPEIAMAIQYYDTSLNYIEVPTLVPPEGGELDEASASINQDLEQLAQEYAWVQDSPVEEAVYTSQQCIFYPAETDRYLNLVLYQNDGSYGSSGDIHTWCYDKEEQTLVTTQQALELAGLTEDLLCSSLVQYVTNNTNNTLAYALTPVPIQEPAQIQGFRIGGDGHVVFYLSVTTDFVHTDTGGEYDPWWHIYRWENGSFTHYNPASWETVRLVPAEETLSLDPPLWCQWNFAGTGPKGATPVPPWAPTTTTRRPMPLCCAICSRTISRPRAVMPIWTPPATAGWTRPSTPLPSLMWTEMGRRNWCCFSPAKYTPVTGAMYWPMIRRRGQ